MSETSHLQTFRCKSRLLDLPVYLESKTDDYIVLWHDVKPLFPGARCVMNGNKVVPFLKDESFQTIVPERIKYQPDVVLDVVLENSNISSIQAPISTESLLAPTPSPTEETVFAVQAMEPSDMASVSDEDDATLSRSHNPQTQGDLQLAVRDVASQGSDIKVIENLMNERFGHMNEHFGHMNERFTNLNAVLDDNKVLQVELLEMQRRMHDMQQQTLDRLAIIQNRIHAVFTATFELHQYPVPRLFIVLPPLTRRRDRADTLLANRFRLYFLCECGGHTNGNGIKSPHTVHLAKHEGYDLKNPAEFFRTYGAYVQVMMQMFKFGYTDSGIVVPPLSIFESEEEDEKSAIRTRVDETIGFLEKSLGSVGIGSTAGGSGIELDQQEAFDGTDLRQLESYLHFPDKGRTLGNLYRTVTPEGQVKWICLDHYRALHRGFSDQNLRETVEVNGGTYHPAEGQIHIKLTSKTLARQFYDVLAKSQRVQELYICLAWDASMKDLRDLREAVIAANIAILTIDGSYFKGPTRDILNNGRRFDPVVELISSGQIQSLDLQNFAAFYERIGMFTSVKTPLIRALRINTDILFESNTKKGERSLLTSLLQSRQSLEKLTLHCVDIAKVFNFIVSTVPSHGTINTLRLRSSSAGCTLMLDISEGAVRTMAATLRHGIKDPGLTSILLRGHLTQLTIKQLLSSQDKDILTKVVRSNPSLKEIHCLCGGFEYQEHVTVFSNIRKAIIKQDGSCSLRRLQLKRHRSGDSKDGKGEHLEMNCDYTESKDGFNAHSIVHMGDLKYSTYNTTTYCDHLRLYGWTVQVLTTNSAFSDKHAQHFLSSLDDKRSKLTKLSLVTGSLSTEGLHCMSRIISASPLLTDLDLHFDDLHIHERLDAATVILLLHGVQMTGLTLNGKTALQWLEKLCTTFPARTAWPKLKSLGLIRAHDNSVEEVTAIVHELSEGVAKWIAGMVAAHPSSSSDAEASSGPSNDWTLITEAMDITALESVSFKCSSIGSIQLDVLKELLPDDISVTPP
ncbi:hypothetical protein EC968_008911 [Mortierella alpina]|nr:hypothetical protein EC968_008911 [Mortierella alpina]